MPWKDDGMTGSWGSLSGDIVMECFLQLHFCVVVAPEGGFPVLPWTGGRRRIRFNDAALVVKGCQQMSEIGVVNVPAMQLVRRRPLEGIGRGFADERSQERAFAIGQRHG